MFGTFQKEENCLIHKIQFINKLAKRQVEVILVSKKYGDHLFSTFRETYFLKIDISAEIPDYKDIENCYKSGDLGELFPSLNPIKETSLFLRSLSEILNGTRWPENAELSGLRTQRMGFQTKVGYKNPPYLDEIKLALSDLVKEGFKIVYDECDLPPYEQSFMTPGIIYKHVQSGNTFQITFQTRDQEFYVSRNDDSSWFYGRTYPGAYEELKEKIRKTSIII